MDRQTTWVFVGDASRARIFVQQDFTPRLHLLREFDHPESRLPNNALRSDRPGRVQQSSPPPRGKSSNGPNRANRSAMEPHTSPKTVEHEHFAHELATVLYKGLTDQSYQHLVLVAGPEFLGLLRNVLDQQVSKRVRASLDKDYTGLTQAELEQRLAALLTGPPADSAQA